MAKRVHPTEISVTTADAFSRDPYGGNPAAVCVLQHGGPRDISRDATWMQNVALEMHLSETAFLQPTSKECGPWNSFDLRWFTPTAEVDLCGHATLASAHVLWESGQAEGEEIVFNTQSGQLKATKKPGSDWIELNFPEEHASELPPDAPERQQLSTALHCSEKDILHCARNRMDVLCEVSPAVFASMGKEPDFGLMKKIQCRVLIITATAKEGPVQEMLGVAGGLDGEPFDFVSRAFAPLVGVDEDPVCGSAHCALTPYWSKKLDKQRLLARQASPRGGSLIVQMSDKRVLIAGQAVTTMKGVLLH